MSHTFVPSANTSEYSRRAHMDLIAAFVTRQRNVFEPSVIRSLRRRGLRVEPDKGGIGLRPHLSPALTRTRLPGVRDWETIRPTTCRKPQMSYPNAHTTDTRGRPAQRLRPSGSTDGANSGGRDACACKHPTPYQAQAAQALRTGPPACIYAGRTQTARGWLQKPQARARSSSRSEADSRPDLYFINNV